MANAKKIIFKNTDAVLLSAGRYKAVIVPSMGAAVLRLRDEENKAEIFRFDENADIDTINKAREIWGLPTLFLPNRFDRGIIKTSDAQYRLPVNEKKFDNHLHGFVQHREHKIKDIFSDDNKAVLTTCFHYDQNDEFYKYLPLEFEISYTFELSKNGFLQKISLLNLSDKRLPVSICTHTCINAPLVDKSDPKNLRISVPASEKCELDGRNLPTERLVPLSPWDKEYTDGTKIPVFQKIENDMYTAGMNTLDGRDFYGTVITDLESGLRLCNEVSPEFKFWNIWNDEGFKGYFCPEPMTAMINAPNLDLPHEVSGYRELEKGEAFKCWQSFFTYKADY